jgi:3-hydroxyisobutyrate dehydrogenase
MSETTDQDIPDDIPDLQGQIARDDPMELSLGTPIGFIGLGSMGLPMAAGLVRGGHAVLACDVDPGRLALLIENVGPGAPLHTTPIAAEVGARCDIVVLMLPTSAEVCQVVRDELMDALPDGALIIDMGSSIPEQTRMLAMELAEVGRRLVDAPVSGGVPKARDGTLSILVGGEPDDVVLALPILRVMGERLFRTGPVGSAHAMKALNNFVYAAGLLAACEALRLAEAAGLDQEILVDVMNASSGRNFATETKLKQLILSGTYDGGFSLALMAKDLEIAGSLAREAGSTPDCLTACRAAWQRALAEIGGDADNSAIHRTIGQSPA